MKVEGDPAPSDYPARDPERSEGSRADYRAGHPDRSVGSAADYRAGRPERSEGSAADHPTGHAERSEGSALPRRGFWRRFGVLFGAGVVGVIALLPMIAPTVRAQLATLPDPGVPFGVVLALSTVNPLLLLAIGVAGGIRLAPRLGLTSLLDDWAATGAPVLPRLKPHLRVAVLTGVAGGATLVILDLLLAPWVAAGVQVAGSGQGMSIAALVGGMIYGGVTEELMLRWGLMTFLAWVGWRVLARGRGAAGASIMWGAIVGSAIAFGLGHLPAVAALAPLTLPLVLRTVGLNALGGVIFGWLYWRRNLEAAMVAHATFHVVFAAANLLVV